ncbi:hypothetical protein M8J76_016457 [Diaphorina citri]|nr:hypothetical protein M8J76_016457 [Diaphorina citri]
MDKTSVVLTFFFRPQLGLRLGPASTRTQTGSGLNSDSDWVRPQLGLRLGPASTQTQTGSGLNSDSDWVRPQLRLRLGPASTQTQTGSGLNSDSDWVRPQLGLRLGPASTRTQTGSGLNSDSDWVRPQLGLRLGPASTRTQTGSGLNSDSDWVRPQLRLRLVSGAQQSGKADTPSRAANDIADTPTKGPYIDRQASKNVTALLGKTAYLICKVRNLGNKTVSFVRHRDIHLLTTGRYTYTNDQRFRVINNPTSDDWTLQLKYPQHKDTGIYECQVSTTPHQAHYIYLTVVEPETDIIGGPEVFIENGSTINLTCVVRFSPEPPAYIFWNHNEAIISYDSQRGGVNVITEKGETTVSYLLIQKARPSDNGKYQCNPANSQAKSVMVNVLNGEHPAAMQRGGQSHHRCSEHFSSILFTCLLIILCFL